MCEVCKTAIQFAACSNCQDARAYPAGAELEKSMECYACNRTSSRSSWRLGSRPAADWYRSNYDFVVTQWVDVERRSIDGTLAGSTGIFGATEGEFCTMIFNEHHLHVFLEHSHEVWPLSSITGMDFGGSGASVMKSGGGWGGGGFGLTGFAVGLGVAAALNKATTKTHVMMDSYMSVSTDEKSIILASSTFDPRTLRSLMDAPMARIQAAWEEVVGDELLAESEVSIDFSSEQKRPVAIPLENRPTKISLDSALAILASLEVGDTFPAKDLSRVLRLGIRPSLVTQKAAIAGGFRIGLSDDSEFQVVDGRASWLRPPPGNPNR